MHVPAPPAWRPMRPADFRACARIERASRPPLAPEGKALFANRLGLFPAGCLVVDVAVGSYAVAHPWAGPAPALGTPLAALPDAPDQLFLHDVALQPDLRWLGLVASLLRLREGVVRALGLWVARLTAVHGTVPMWERLGFVLDGGMAAAGYGEHAAGMRRTLPAA